MGFWDVESGPAVKFARIGDSVTGTITRPYALREATEIGSNRPKLDSRGQPVQMAVVELQTDVREGPDDDGIQILYADKFAMRKAIGQAIREAGADDMEVGGRLTVTFVSESPSDKGAPQKNFSAKYVRPGAASTWGAEPNALVSAARNAQVSASAGSAPPPPPAPPAAPQTPPPAVNGRTTTPEQDMNKIRELIGYGLDAGMIHQAVPHLSIEAVNALINIAKSQVGQPA